MDARLERIESKLALAEDLLDELNKTFYAQEKRLAQLEAAMLALREQVQTLAPPEARDAAAEVPPHY
jgi:SlyX protein